MNRFTVGTLESFRGTTSRENCAGLRAATGADGTLKASRNSAGMLAPEARARLKTMVRVWVGGGTGSRDVVERVGFEEMKRTRERGISTVSTGDGSPAS